MARGINNHGQIVCWSSFQNSYLLTPPITASHIELLLLD